MVDDCSVRDDLPQSLLHNYYGKQICQADLMYERCTVPAKSSKNPEKNTCFVVVASFVENRLVSDGK